MLVGEIIARVQSLYSKGVKSDDSRLSERHIYSKIVNIRSKLISQKINKRQKISQWTYQTLPCVEFIKAPPYDCPCLPPIGCEILKTKKPLPKLITNLDKHLLQSVTSLDGSVVYSEVGWIEKKYKSFNKYTSTKPDYFIRDNYLYITHKNGPKIIAVTGLFEDPLEAIKYPSYCNNEDEDCKSPLDKDFPISKQLAETLIEMCINELVVTFSQNIEDLTNNSTDNPVEQSK